MKWISKSKKPKYSLKRFFQSFGYAFIGILTVYKTEQNILIHTIFTILVTILGFYLKISNIEWCILVLVISLVIALEIINTSIEYAIDMAMPNIHPMAKMAKDAASGAVLVSAIGSIIIGLIIFLPKILSLF